MSIQTVINVTCNGDNCTHTRTMDANHWLVGVVVEKVIYVAASREDLPTIWGRTKKTLSENIPIKNEDISDFCGQACLLKWISKQLMEIRDEIIYEAPEK